MRYADPQSRASVAWLRTSERGLTLTELAIVGLLAVIVMLSLTGFYFNAQRIWLDTSTKAMTQRDAALLIDVLGRYAHRAAKAVIVPTDASHDQLSLYADKNDLVPRDVFYFDSADRRVHRQENGTDVGSIVDSEALRFQFTLDNDSLLTLTAAQLASSNDDRVFIATSYQLLGR
jgi:hypothetical protein